MFLFFDSLTNRGKLVPPADLVRLVGSRANFPGALKNSCARRGMSSSGLIPRRIQPVIYVPYLSRYIQ